MKLSELIAHVGDDNVQFQNLQESTISASGGAGKPTKITFGTNAVTAHELLAGETKMLGLVVWIPKDKLPKK